MKVFSRSWRAVVARLTGADIAPNGCKLRAQRVHFARLTGALPLWKTESLQPLQSLHPQRGRDGVAGCLVAPSPPLPQNNLHADVLPRMGQHSVKGERSAPNGCSRSGDGRQYPPRSPRGFDKSRPVGVR